MRQHHKDVSLMLKHAKRYHRHLALPHVHLGIVEKAMAAGGRWVGYQRGNKRNKARRINTFTSEHTVERNIDEHEEVPFTA